jgi:hypothetical protein
LSDAILHNAQGTDGVSVEKRIKTPNNREASDKLASPNGGIAAEINSLSKQYGASQENRAKYHEEVLLWTKRASAGVLAAVIARALQGQNPLKIERVQGRPGID